MPLMIEFPGFSPEVFTIALFGMEFALRWYALAYIAGILIGWRIVVAARSLSVGSTLLTVTVVLSLTEPVSSSVSVRPIV